MGHNVCLKIRGLEELRKEVEVYMHLQALQGTVIPQFYGLFSYLDFHFILLSRIPGAQIQEFGALSITQRYVLIVRFPIV